VRKLLPITASGIQEKRTSHDCKTLGQSIEAFEKQFMSEGMVNPPCPKLDGTLCSIYENRLELCKSFPHLEQPGFTTRLMGVIDNVAICPIAFNAFEELKTRLGWLPDRRKRQH
jgi:Fe-S-cluster containining protein